MKKEYGVSYKNSKGVKHWVVFENKFGFTLSKAKFLAQSLVKRGLFDIRELTVESIQ